MKRILFASWYSGLGGGETDLLSLAGSLDAGKVESHLLLPADGRLAEAWRAAGGRIHIIPYRGASTVFLPAVWARFPVVRRFAELLRRERIDLVHSDYHTLPFIAPAAKRVGLPLMWTVHGWWFRPKPWQRAFFRDLCAVARSKAIRDGFLGEPPFMPAAALPVVYSGIDTKRFHPGLDGISLRREIGLDDDAKVVAMAGRFQRVKGHHVFQAMAERVLAALPATQFVIAGDEAFGAAADERYRDEILARAASSSLLRERLHYIGFREDIENVYAAADVFVCPSEFESYGKANLEAMACAAPVVSTRRGGPSETVIDGVTGFLVDNGDVEAMADRVMRLLADALLRESIGAAGRQRVDTSFSLEAASAAYQRKFEELLQLN
ncbi:MAG: glycosyltransferase family 4 protein [Chloroflexi bacterium]|nr:glycosyltransferase family 4 protein [Chloroflexota bacterium]